VARRIAHEIKNPLTPIQLSAERLRRKYLREIRSDPDTFSICHRHHHPARRGLGRMVDEFSSFARMPAPVIKTENLVEICRQALFLQRNAHIDIDFELVPPDEPPLVSCDARLIGQALTNLLKNAVESIQGRAAGESGAPRGNIVLRLSADEGQGAAVAVEDNGKGLPDRERERLTEPYVTTRAKGTGLGLAIVQEDHGRARRQPRSRGSPGGRRGRAAELCRDLARADGGRATPRRFGRLIRRGGVGCDISRRQPLDPACCLPAAVFETLG